MSKRVLLLSASAGAGHMRAADGLFKVFKEQPGVDQVEHWDMLKYTNRVFEHLYGRMYLDLVNKVPEMLGWLYDLSDTPYRHDKVRVAFEKLNASRFIKALDKYDPSLVVCTHFTPAAILSWLFEKKELSILPAVVVTDMDCHAMWLVKHYLKYFVAIEETKVHLEALGIERDRIAVTGIPIDPVFEEQKDQWQIRQALGLAPDRPTIMVSAGGFGVGPVEQLIRELMRVSIPVQIVAIAGRSEELTSNLEAIARESSSPAALHPVGFTTKMDEYMAASDILVGKAGGLTSSEALARGLPLCIVNPIPGQEERNSDHLLEEGAAVRCNNLATLAWKLQGLLTDPVRLENLRKNAKRMGRPAAARVIVESLLKV